MFPSAPQRNLPLFLAKASLCPFLGYSGAASVISVQDRRVMQFTKHNVETPPERKPKWLRKGIALLAAIATLATGGIVASTAYAGGVRIPVGGRGGGAVRAYRAGSGPWVRDGDTNASRAGRKWGRRPAGRVRPGRRGGPPECHFAPLPIAYCLSPVELGLVCGQDGFVVFFRSVGQEDRRLSHAESRLVQGQQYPGSLASEVFPADKQDRRIRA